MDESIQDKDIQYILELKLFCPHILERDESWMKILLVVYEFQFEENLWDFDSRRIKRNRG